MGDDNTCTWCGRTFDRVGAYCSRKCEAEGEDDRKRQRDKEIQLEMNEARKPHVERLLQNHEKHLEARQKEEEEAKERERRLEELRQRAANQKRWLGLNAKGWFVFAFLLLWCFPLVFIPWLVPALTEGR